MNTGSALKSVSQGIGAAALLISQSAQSDEALIQPGTSLGQFPASSISSLQNTIATQLVSDITPDPSLLPSTSFRWLLVKTESGLALTLPENYAGNIMHFGQQEKFFVRFDRTTGLPEISFDLQSWQPYTAGTPVNISREEQATLLDISANLQTLNALQIEEQALSTTLATQQNELAQVQAELNQLETDFDASLADLTTTNSTLSSKEAAKTSLESSIVPEAKLRTDTHPVAANTTLDDAVKNTSIQSALNTYDNTPSTVQSMQVQSFSLQSNILQTETLLSATFTTNTPQTTATSIIPTAADVQSTINVLTSELSRIQTQINTVNSQISAKQAEIKATENSITQIQQTIDALNIQINDYLSTYYYWNDEYNYWDGKVDDAITNMGSARTSYNGTRDTLMIEGNRSDVPSNLDDPNIATQVDTLKSRISTESVSLANTTPTNSWGTDTTTKNLTTYTSTTYIRMGGQYYYKVFFSTTGGYPATIKMYSKFIGDSSYTLSTKTYTAYNYTHRMAIVNQTVLPFCAKACDYALADRKLETYQENYLQYKGDRDSAIDERHYAYGQRDEAWSDLSTANALAIQRNAEKDALVTQKSTLTTQKSELETLKNTKATLQSLYNRVKTILDQLQQHVASHGTITQEIATLIQQANELESYIATLDILIEYAEGDEADLLNQVGSTSENITTVRNALSQNEQQLLAILNTIHNIIPQDTFNRNGTQLTPASEALKFFGDGFRTGYFSGSLSGLPAKWVTQYEWTKGINDIYPAYGAIQYSINGRAYRTDAQRMNNFAHKELVNGYNADAVNKLNACIALLNQYPQNSTEGIENFLTALKGKIAELQASQSTNVTIKNHVTLVNDFTKKTLLQGGSYVLFEQLLSQNTAFASKIEAITATAVQKGNIPAGTDAIIDMRHMITTIMAREFAEQLMHSGTEGLNMYVNWQQEVLSFINGLGDATIWDKQWDINTDWGIDDHGNKYKFGLYHPGGANNSLYSPPATLFMLYSPDGVNTQVLGPVTVSSSAEAESMKARGKEELLKMKRSHVENYSGGDYDVFRGWDETGEYVYWGKYVFGGQFYQTGFQSSDEITVGNYIQKLLEQKLQASQRASSYENQYDEIWAGYEYTTALYAQSIPNYPYVQKAPHIVLHNALETLLYNRIVALESQYLSLSSLDARSDNLIERSQLYQSISKPHYERLRTLVDGVEKDAEVAKARLIGHELTKIAILQCQISAERELGIERIEAIKAGTELVLGFIPIVNTGVSIALLFDESKSLDEKAWELSGLIPYGKSLKYVGKIDEVVELANNKMVRRMVKFFSPFEFEKTPGNPIDPVDLAKLKEQITAANNFIVQPIEYFEYNGTKFILNGHHRIRAAKELGITSVPSVKINSLPYGNYRDINDLFF